MFNEINEDLRSILILRYRIQYDCFTWLRILIHIFFIENTALRISFLYGKYFHNCLVCQFWNINENTWYRISMSSVQTIVVKQNCIIVFHVPLHVTGWWKIDVVKEDKKRSFVYDYSNLAFSFITLLLPFLKYR